MTKEKEQRHSVVVIHFCQNNHKTGTGGVGFVRVY